MESFKFNKDLQLGIATASTQIEGKCTNHTWYEWTKNNDKTKDGTNCFRANNHYEKYKEHIDLMQKMGFEIYRLSLEWARIEPEPGVFDKEAMEHYIDEIKYLKAKNIKPLVTLHHFSNPLWFDKMGGFNNKKCVEIFDEYTRYVVKAFGDEVNEYCTINEPNVYTLECFLFKEWLNEESKPLKAIRILNNMAKCHIQAYKSIHELNKNAFVGIALNINYFIPARPNNKSDIRMAKFFDKCYNKAITFAMGQGKLIFPLGHHKATGDYFDYFGVNYYTSNLVKGFNRFNDPNWKLSDMNQGITPFGFDAILQEYHELFPTKPIFITENGLCDNDDSRRTTCLYEHLKVLSDKPYVKRYYHWTFMDNFEWKEGEKAKFGLVKYNYDDETYEIKKSGYFFMDVIKNKGVTKEMIKKYQIGE